MHGAVTTIAAAQPAAPRPFAVELRATLALALPLALTQLAQMLVHTTEVLLLGRVSAEALAAASLGAALVHLAAMFATGVVSATAPLIAQARGARRPREVRRAVRQGLWVALLVSLPLMAALSQAEPILLALGQDPALVALTRGYVRTALLGIPFAAGFIVLRSLVASHGRTRPVLLATLIAVLLNLPISYALIFGVPGHLPALGPTGAGIGVAVTFAIMFAGLLGYCLRAARFRRYHLLGRLWRPDWAIFRDIVRLGLPIGVAIVMEVGIFAAAALMMGRIGTAELAAHQVALQLAATAFMVPLGISHAATIRVGLAMGALDPMGARRAGFVALGLGAGFMAGMGLLFWIAAEPLTGLFIGAEVPGAAAALTLAASYLRIAALFQLVDGLQVIGIAALRGLKDTRVPMLLAAASYWGVGLPACLVLGFWTPLAGHGVWLGLALALAVAALVMVRRFERLTRRAVAAPLAAPAFTGR
jgi:MATE family multidrug resistance protein